MQDLKDLRALFAEAVIDKLRLGEEVWLNEQLLSKLYHRYAMHIALMVINLPDDTLRKWEEDGCPNRHPSVIAAADHILARLVDHAAKPVPIFVGGA